VAEALDGTVTFMITLPPDFSQALEALP